MENFSDYSNIRRDGHLCHWWKDREVLIATEMNSKDVTNSLFRAMQSHLDTSRVVLVPLPSRLSFATAIQYANDHYAGRVVALANSDIAFDGTLSHLLPLESLDFSKQSICLTKWIEEIHLPISPPANEGTTGHMHTQIETNISRVTRSNQDAWYSSLLPTSLVESSRNTTWHSSTLMLWRMSWHTMALSL